MNTSTRTDSRHWLDWRVLVALSLAALTWMAGQPDAQVVSAGEADNLAAETWTAVRSASLANNGKQEIRVRNGGDRRARVQAEVALEPSASKRLRRLNLTVERLAVEGDLMSSPAPRVTLGWLRGDQRIGWAPTLHASSWRTTSTLDAVLTVPMDVDGLRVAFVVPEIGSEWRLSSVLLRPVVATSWVGATRVALALSWALLLAWFLLPALRRLSLLQIGLVCAGIAIVVLGTGFSRQSLAVVSHPIVAVLTDVFKLTNSDAGWFVYKGGHYVAFLLLVIVLFAMRIGLALRVVSVAGLCIAIAIGSEALQLFVVGRSTRSSDIAIDIAGIATGLLGVVLWQALRRSGRSWTEPLDS